MTKNEKVKAVMGQRWNMQVSSQSGKQVWLQRGGSLGTKMPVSSGLVIAYYFHLCELFPHKSYNLVRSALGT